MDETVFWVRPSTFYSHSDSCPNIRKRAADTSGRFRRPYLYTNSHKLNPLSEAEEK